MKRPLRYAILGAGFIGMDLLMKAEHNPLLECRLVIGRNENSSGYRKAKNMGFQTSALGSDALLEFKDHYDIVFDCTDANANLRHWEMVQGLSKYLVNLTPGFSGEMICPSVNLNDVGKDRNLNLISCGGQTILPAIDALVKAGGVFKTCEVVTTAASKSVGQGTRVNLDEYIGVTQRAVQTFSKADHVKAMVNLSPAKPPVRFRVSLNAKVEGLCAARFEQALAKRVDEMQIHCKGYRIEEARFIGRDQIFISVSVQGNGDYLPKFAGNLDIINIAAVRVAERISLMMQGFQTERMVS